MPNHIESYLTQSEIRSPIHFPIQPQSDPQSNLGYGLLRSLKGAPRSSTKPGSSKPGASGAKPPGSKPKTVKPKAAKVKKDLGKHWKVFLLNGICALCFWRVKKPLPVEPCNLKLPATCAGVGIHEYFCGTLAFPRIAGPSQYSRANDFRETEDEKNWYFPQLYNCLWWTCTPLNPFRCCS